MDQKHTKQGGVIWISGYSAAGKTTIGRYVNHLLQADGHATLFLDGDQLRSIFGNKWNYTREERVELALIYFRLCSHLSKQGLIVIISAVAMLEEPRRWFKENVENGLEVYLDVPLEARLERDALTKGVYKRKSFDNNDYVEPEHPDLVIQNFGNVSYQNAGKLVVDNYYKRKVLQVDHGRTQYWSEYYKKQSSVNNPSPFAEYCMSKFSPNKRILEIGCGNGRDSQFFARNGLDVVALDKSEGAINECNQKNQLENLSYSCCETHEVGRYHEGKYDYIYSRFSLHAMTKMEEIKALTAAFELLDTDGIMCIECRSINDPLALKGEVLSPTERIHGHYRRFNDLIDLEIRLERIGFCIKESVESKGLAVYEDEDPMVIRIIASK